MFERFTAEARLVVVEAQQHARRLGHDWLGCEHLLLAVVASASPTGALLREGGATPAAVEEAVVGLIGLGTGPRPDEDRAALAMLGIDLDRVRDAVEETFGRGALEAPATTHRRRRRRWRRRSCASGGGRLRFSPRAKRCLELALREALRLGHHHLGVEHVALVLLSRDDTAAWAALCRAGVEPPALERRLRESLRRSA